MALHRHHGKGAAAAVVAALAFSLSTLPAGAQTGPEVVASGLDNPRGLTVTKDGTLLVAEAGRGGDGPCMPGPEDGEVCYGLSGAVTQVVDGVQSRLVSDLPSLAAPDGGEATGPMDISVDDGPTNPGTYLVVGLGGSPETRADLPASAAAMGKLHKIVDGAPQPLADLADYEARQNPDNGQPGSAVDSNPQGLLAVYGQQFITDAGGNDLIHRDVNGNLSTLAVFDVRQADAPPFLGLPPGTKLPWQAVPTTVALGPDGALYVGQLTGFPFTKGGANIYRWAADGVTTYATGFTNIIDIAFAPDGSLYVLEIAKESLLQADAGGRLVRIDPDGTQTTVIDEGLVTPTSVAVTDDSIYVSNCGTCAGDGEVLRWDL